ncbi:acetate kinase [Acinetobacter marinus]|uniref:Acetate kinase n=1 Tax=Acinetobacter marinus TaxID=281375 RepID=A0A1G6KN96_9GAMM|nr:acetate kinase [Acinetobacter marinus]
MSNILVINCGSSSIKYALILQDYDYRLYGLAENLGTPQARISGITKDKEKFVVELGLADHEQALSVAMQRISHFKFDAIGHRVVHGGTMTHARLIDDQVIEDIQNISNLAPLHNPANLIGINATMKLYPDLPQVTVFDTAFHQTMPNKAYLYALPRELHQQYGIRRYGFHGTSHAYVSERASTLAGQKNQGGWIVAHLGNGCSTCAVWNGQSLDTSMGLTPLEGVVMGTRSGDVDPSLHYFLNINLGWDLAKIDQVLNKDSGLLGLSGLSNDMRTLVEAAEHGNADAQIAIDVFVYRLAKSMAAMSCALPQLDGLIFTGGIGENSGFIREKVIWALPHFGLSLNAENNATRAQEIRIDDGTGPQIWVIPTDEEGRIANETRHIALGEAVD